MPSGSCLCGKVSFSVTGELPPASACHCSQCRKQSGHFWASTHVPETALTFASDDTLDWFSASETAKRGFCSACGSFLFWKHRDENEISISMGAFEAPTETSLGRHIFVADKGDYYDLTDGLPQRDQ